MSTTRSNLEAQNLANEDVVVVDDNHNTNTAVSDDAPDYDDDDDDDDGAKKKKKEEEYCERVPRFPRLGGGHIALFGGGLSMGLGVCFRRFFLRDCQ